MRPKGGQTRAILSFIAICHTIRIAIQAGLCRADTAGLVSKGARWRAGGKGSADVCVVGWRGAKEQRTPEGRADVGRDRLTHRMHLDALHTSLSRLMVDWVGEPVGRHEQLLVTT